MSKQAMAEGKNEVPDTPKSLHLLVHHPGIHWQWSEVVKECSFVWF
jgi:hypothetical protein